MNRPFHATHFRPDEGGCPCGVCRDVCDRTIRTRRAEAAAVAVPAGGAAHRSPLRRGEAASAAGGAACAVMAVPAAGGAAEVTNSVVSR